MSDLTVVWPSARAKSANVWRLLDLSGLTKSVRESRNYTLAGFVYIDGNKVTSLNYMIPIGTNHLLEVRFQNGRILSVSFFLSQITGIRMKPRNQNVTTLNRKG